jgi:hypothetical protein
MTDTYLNVLLPGLKELWLLAQKLKGKNLRFKWNIVKTTNN